MYDAKDYMMKDQTVMAIRKESARAMQKHGRENTTVNQAMDRERKLAVLVEEVGEVANVINEFALGNLNHEELLSQIVKELEQVASVAALWLESEQDRIVPTMFGKLK